MKNLKNTIYKILGFAIVIIGCSVQKPVNSGRIKTDTKFNVLILKKNEMSFGVSTTKPKDADFYINSNFFESKTKTLGLVVVNGKRYSDREKSGGYFYVVNGKPHISSRYCPRMTEYASQVYWGIDNGVRNEYIINRPLSNNSRYRTIMGENKEGDIIVISSNRIGFVTMKEIIDYAQNMGMVEGILLDGGTSVDYKFSDDTNEVVFQSVPDAGKTLMNIDQPTTYIYGNFKNK
jgi:exopolysaccharide biosynthesis protein